MHLFITGFLPGDDEDDSLKYELDIPIALEQAVMDILGWKSLAEEANGVLPLTGEQVGQIASAVKQSLPRDLDMFIGVVA